MDLDRYRAYAAGAGRHLSCLALAAAALLTLSGPVWAAEEAAENMLPEYVDELLSLLVKVLAAALIALVGMAVRRLAKKWGIEHTETLEELERKNAQAALHFSDRWARQQAEKPSGEAKLEKGLDRLIEIEGLSGVGDEKRKVLARRVEAELEVETKKNGT